MKKLMWVARLIIGAAGAFQSKQFGLNAGAQPSTLAGWSVHFSPKGGCTEAVITELGKAKSSVLVQAYSFTSAWFLITMSQMEGKKR